MITILHMLLISLLSFALAGTPNQDEKVRHLRDDFAHGRPLLPYDLALGESWGCRHFNAFRDDKYIEKNVTMRFQVNHLSVRNRGNFVIKQLKFTHSGLRGNIQIPEYQGATLFGELRLANDGRLIGEVSVLPSTLRILSAHYHWPGSYEGVEALGDVNRVVFYYTECSRSQKP